MKRIHYRAYQEGCRHFLAFAFFAVRFLAGLAGTLAAFFAGFFSAFAAFLDTAFLPCAASDDFEESAFEAGMVLFFQSERKIDSK